jgi:hypothetical protein
MSDIKVGDVVMVVTNDYEKPHEGLVSLLNKTGVVRTLGSRLGVEFDHTFPGGHNLQGKIATNRGWNIPLAALTKMKPIKEVFQDLREEATPKKEKVKPKKTLAEMYFVDKY